MFRFLTMSPLLLLTVAFVSRGMGGFSDEFAAWPFAVALVAVGLPHGAIDLRLAAKLQSVSLPIAATRFGWYVLLMCGATLCLWLSPSATLTGFVILSSWHFGRADVDDHKTVLEDDTRIRDLAEGPSTTWMALTAWARGLLILALPLCFHVEQSIEVAETLVRLCGADLRANFTLLERGAILVSCVCGTFEVSRMLALRFAGHVRLSRLILLELCSLVSAFWMLHPMFAMGLYFGCWHSWRHLRRLNSVLCPNQNHGLRAILRLHFESLPLLLPTLAMVWVICIQLAGGINIRNTAFTSLLVYAVVTLPHELLCGRLFQFLSHAGPRDDIDSLGLNIPRSASCH